MMLRDAAKCQLIYSNICMDVFRGFVLGIDIPQMRAGTLQTY